MDDSGSRLSFFSLSLPPPYLPSHTSALRPLAHPPQPLSRAYQWLKTVEPKLHGQMSQLKGAHCKVATCCCVVKTLLLSNQLCVVIMAPARWLEGRPTVGVQPQTQAIHRTSFHLVQVTTYTTWATTTSQNKQQEGTFKK